jgi:hypothetical protein
MPVGRTYDIKTGKDWEGDGIAPDIAVDPKQALIVALEKSGLSHEQAVKLDAAEVPAEPVHRDTLKARQVVRRNGPAVHRVCAEPGCGAA